jgi:peroxiredoxin
LLKLPIISLANPYIQKLRNLQYQIFTMRKFLLILLMPLAVVAQPGKKTKPGKAKPATVKPVKAMENKFVLSGTITDMPDKTEVSLMSSDGKGTILATAKSVKNKFSLSAVLPVTGIYLLQFPQQQAVPLFIGNETISATGDIHDVTNIKFKGSPTQDDFTAYTVIMQPLLEQSNAITQMASTGGVTDSLRTAYTNTSQGILAAADAFLNKKPASPVSALMLLVIKRFAPSGDYIEQRYNLLATQGKESFYGKMLGQSINEVKSGPNPVGAMAPDFSQNDTNGTPVSLSSFKGKYVLVDFWASWCRPCREENPNVVDNYNRFKNKNFTVLGVSLDRAKEAWVQAIADDNLAWTQVSDLKFWSNDVAKLYSVGSIPQNFLVGPDGKIVAKNLRGPALEATLCQILGCN